MPKSYDKKVDLRITIFCITFYEISRRLQAEQKNFVTPPVLPYFLRMRLWGFIYVNCTYTILTLQKRL